MKIVSIFAGHDSSITFYDTESQSVHVIEIERLVRKRYFRLHVDNDKETITSILQECADIARKEWGFTEIDLVVITADGSVYPQVLAEVFKPKQMATVPNHHDCHASCTYFLSPYNETLIFSFDGGGNDGFFNIYHAKDGKIQLLEKIKSDFGGGYLLGSSILHEISNNSRHQLALAGKAMGLCAYGSPRKDIVPYFSEFLFDRDYKKLSEKTGLDLLNLEDPWTNPMSNAKFSEQDAYDLAATLQEGFEEAFISVFRDRVKMFPNIDGVCFAGGGSLNVLLNERIKKDFGIVPYVPPNPNDCGLSTGAAFLVSPPTKRPVVTYSGLPLLDREDLDKHVQERGAKKVELSEVATLLKGGKIIGMVSGDSEVGPRALGNRSIVCDPAYDKMKDSLNSKVKFREWYRPFAPFCKKEDAHLYFDSPSFDNMEYMSYAPLVKPVYREKMPAITHIDGSSRLQTVERKDHELFYDLLTEFGKLSDTRVLLNTSFNIRGKPILSTIVDALYVLDNTEMDYVVIEGYLFSKSEKDT